MMDFPGFLGHEYIMEPKRGWVALAHPGMQQRRANKTSRPYLLGGVGSEGKLYGLI